MAFTIRDMTATRLVVVGFITLACAGSKASKPDVLIEVRTANNKTVVFTKRLNYRGKRRVLPFRYKGHNYSILLYSKRRKSPFSGKVKDSWYVELHRGKDGKGEALTSMIQSDVRSPSNLGTCGMTYDYSDTKLRLYLGVDRPQMSAARACKQARGGR